MAYQGGYRHDEPAKVGVLLANLGTPDAPEPAALQRYLAEFLWDPRVVELPRPLWWLILHGVVLRTRPARSAALYRKIWTPEGSPLLTISRRQEAGLRERLGERVVIELGMRYGQPSIPAALRRLRDANAQRILVLSLYPQYSCSTTASNFDAVAQELKTWRWVPELRIAGDYHAADGYVAALAASIAERWARDGGAERVLFSFHGTPLRYREAGDPYYYQCLETARLTAARLGLASERWQVAFQSRFGREEWLQPYTSETLAAWGAERLGSVDVVCPGFGADCLETLEEIAVENRRVFVEAGGGRYRYIPALNDRADHMDFLAALTGQHLSGW